MSYDPLGDWEKTKKKTKENVEGFGAFEFDFYG